MFTLRFIQWIKKLLAHASPSIPQADGRHSTRAVTVTQHPHASLVLGAHQLSPRDYQHPRVSPWPYKWFRFMIHPPPRYFWNITKCIKTISQLCAKKWLLAAHKAKDCVLRQEGKCHLGGLASRALLDSRPFSAQGQRFKFSKRK